MYQYSIFDICAYTFCIYCFCYQFLPEAYCLGVRAFASSTYNYCIRFNNKLVQACNEKKEIDKDDLVVVLTLSIILVLFVFLQKRLSAFPCILDIHGQLLVVLVLAPTVIYYYCSGPVAVGKYIMKTHGYDLGLSCAPSSSDSDEEIDMRLKAIDFFDWA